MTNLKNLPNPTVFVVDGCVIDLTDVLVKNSWTWN